MFGLESLGFGATGGPAVSGTGAQETASVTDLSVNFGGASIGGQKSQATGEQFDWKTAAILGGVALVGIIALKR